MFAIVTRCAILFSMKKLIAISMLFSLTALAGELDTIKKHWATSKNFTIAVAKTMPDASYDFQGAPPELNFGAMVVHIAQANGFYCGIASGMKSPIGKPAKIDQESAVKLLTESFDFCEGVIAKMTPADLDKTMGQGARQMTAREALWSAFTHTAHHRAQLDVFLRLKGIKPPDYQF